MARAFYQKLSDRYCNFYYAELGRQRLKHLPTVAADADDPIRLARSRAPSRQQREGEQNPNHHLTSCTCRKRSFWVMADSSISQCANCRPPLLPTAAVGARQKPRSSTIEAGHYDQAIEVLKHSAPNYFALDIPDLPRKYWEALFPKAYWSDLKRFVRSQWFGSLPRRVTHPAGVGV